MALPAIFAIGAALGIYGQLRANQEEAKANDLNALAYQKQKELSALASARELDIFESESAAFLGDQISSFAKAGVDLSGSALMQIAGTKAAITREHAAITMGAERQASIFDIQARQAKAQAKYLRSPEVFLTQSAGSLLNAYASYQAMGGGTGSGGGSGINSEPQYVQQSGYGRLDVDGQYSGGATRYRFRGR